MYIAVGRGRWIVSLFGVGDLAIFFGFVRAHIAYL